MLSPDDFADLTDDQIRNFGVSLMAQANAGGPYAGLWRALGTEVAALVGRRRRETRREFLLMAQELINDDVSVGALLEPDDDPTGESQPGGGGPL